MDNTRELERREALLDAIRAVADVRGLTHMTLEDAARAASTSVDELRGYFDTKEELAIALITQHRLKLRRRFHEIYDDRSLSEHTRLQMMWQAVLDAEAGERLFFEVYGLALHENDYRDFLHGVTDWIDLMSDELVGRGIAPARAKSISTLTLAVFRGLMMDLCATGERPRVNAAMELYFRALVMLAAP